MISLFGEVEMRKIRTKYSELVEVGVTQRGRKEIDFIYILTYFY